jgi:hypothetical protein
MRAMSSDSVQRGPRVAESVVFRELDGEAVILNLDTGTYFGLDEVGTRIWQRLDRGDPVDAVVAALVEEFEVAPETARADVDRLIAQLVDKGLFCQA